MGQRRYRSQPEGVTVIVAIFGYKRSGKSTLSRAFESRGSHRAPIATPLKEMLRTMGLTDEQLYGSEKEKPSELLGGATPRWAMQSLGTEWGRDCIGPDVWIRSWAHTTPMDKDVVVDDLRFPNEAGYLLSLGAYFIKIERDGTVPAITPRPWWAFWRRRGELHPSEAYVDKLPFDLKISNNGTPAELWDAMDDFRAKHPNVPAEGPARIARFKAVLESLQ